MKQLLCSTVFFIAINAISNNSTPKSNNQKEFWKQPVERHSYYEEKATEHLAKEKPELKNKAKDLLKHQAVKFLENKGQMTDMSGKPVPFVLFKAEAPGIDMYITEKGLTYVMLKHEEEAVAEVLEATKCGNEKNEASRTSASKRSHENEENMKVEWHRIDMDLKGVTIKKENIIAEGKSTYFKQYFLAHCPNGITDVHEYEKITIKNIYPNIDWVLYNSNDKGFKYDFIVHPNADYTQIKMLYKSEESIELDKEGNLHIETEIGSLTENAPYSYTQESKQKIESSFTKKQINKHETEVSFNIQQQLSNNQTLVIDPQLVWSTFIGGTYGHDGIVDIESDSNGNVYLFGYAQSLNFPTLDMGSGYFNGSLGGPTALIMKFNNIGVLIHSTFYWGLIPTNIAINNLNQIVLVGHTSDSTFPTYNAGTFYQSNLLGISDGVIIKFDNLGNLTWATYHGGSDEDSFNAVEFDSNNNIFIVGTTKSNDFPVQNSGTFIQNTFNGVEDGVLLKFDNNGNRLWSTYYGGNNTDSPTCLSIDFNNSLFISGNTKSNDFPMQNSGTYYQGIYSGGATWGDAFILKFDNLGNRLWATYYGGSSSDITASVGLDNNGNLFVLGLTYSYNFPLQNNGSFFQNSHNGSIDAFILKFDNLGNRIWASYFGGSDYETLEYLVPYMLPHLAVDKCNKLYISLETNSTDLICQQNNCYNGYFDNSFNGDYDQFIALFSNDGDLLWSTYFGGDGLDVRSLFSVDKNNDLFFSGEWRSVDITTYPTVNYGGGAFFDNGSNFVDSYDHSFVSKFVTQNITTYTLSQTNPSCACDGIATISINACDNLNFAWSNGTSVNNSSLSIQSITGLCAGVHQVTVTSCGSQPILATFTLISSVTGVSTMTPNITTTNASCNSSTGSATINSILGGTSNYTITEGNTTIANNVAVPYTITNLSTGIHYYTIKDVNGCGTFSVEVFAPVLPNLTTITQVTLGCNPSTVSVTATSTSTNPVTFSWSGPSIVSGANIAIAVVNQVGNYTVTVNEGSCSNFSVVTVVADVNLPILSISDNTIIPLGSQVTLTATSSANTYTWFPNNTLSCNNCSNPIASPSITTKYCVLTSSGTCTTQVCTTVSLELVCGTNNKYEVPNAFSPNGDGYNDDFCLKGWSGCVKQFSILIYNRWGEKMFESEDENFCWDGIYKGNLLDPAVFVYVINAEIENVGKTTKKGNITLIR